MTIDSFISVPVFQSVEPPIDRTNLFKQMLRVATILIITFVLPWVVYGFQADNQPLFWLAVQLLIIIVLSLFISSRHINLARHLLILGCIAHLVALSAIVDGPGQEFGGNAHYFLLVVILVVHFIFEPNQIWTKNVYTFVCVILLFIIEYNAFDIVPLYPLNPQIKIFRHIFLLAGVSIAVAAFSHSFISDIARTEKSLNVANSRLDALVKAMLPSIIANRLKIEGKTFADSVDECSILFADIVGFTQFAEIISPSELVGLLNQIFSKFDYLTEKHGLEKIKTIGDAYMVASGVPEARSDHAKAIANLALDMQLEMVNFSPLSIRIGINSGYAVAGIIGRGRFSYDLWGDAVNVASRMESHGVSGEINISPRVHELLGQGYEFEERGEIFIKGKGKMNTYLLKGKKIIHGDTPRILEKFNKLP